MLMQCDDRYDFFPVNKEEEERAQCDSSAAGPISSITKMMSCGNGNNLGADVLQQEKGGNERIERKGGLEFMALRLSVILRRRELLIRKMISTPENFVLEEIEIGTAGADNSKHQIGSMSDFNIAVLSKNLGYKTPNKIYVLLRSLHEKKLIVREPSPLKGHERIGLNSESFGQILINTQHEIEQRRHLKCVVDNSKRDLTERVAPSHGACDPGTHSVEPDLTERVRNELQVFETIEEKRPLESSRVYLEFLRGGKKLKDDFTLGNLEEEQKQHEQKVWRQLAELKALTERDRKARMLV